MKLFLKPSTGDERNLPEVKTLNPSECIVSRKVKWQHFISMTALEKCLQAAKHMWNRSEMHHPLDLNKLPPCRKRCLCWLCSFDSCFCFTWYSSIFFLFFFLFLWCFLFKKWKEKHFQSQSNTPDPHSIKILKINVRNATFYVIIWMFFKK